MLRLGLKMSCVVLGICFRDSTQRLQEAGFISDEWKRFFDVFFPYANHGRLMLFWVCLK